MKLVQWPRICRLLYVVHVIHGSALMHLAGLCVSLSCLLFSLFCLLLLITRNCETIWEEAAIANPKYLPHP